MELVKRKNRKKEDPAIHINMLETYPELAWDKRYFPLCGKSFYGVNWQGLQGNKEQVTCPRCLSHYKKGG